MKRPARWTHGLRSGVTRRQAMIGAAGLLAASRIEKAYSTAPVTFGLTPVFLDSDVKLLADLKRYLSGQLARPVELVKRRTYQEITLMLLSGQLNAAWICGFPYVQYRDRLSLVAVPLFNGQPLYQSYLIVNERSSARSFSDLRGTVHAFSDPNSNSGFLVTRALLASIGERPETYFKRHFFTYGHRNVIRAVSAALAESGSVDGYVWEVVNAIEPTLTTHTRVIRRSQWLGFPPIACSRTLKDWPVTRAIAKALFEMPKDPLGHQILDTLHLDGFAPAKPALFDGIARLYQIVRTQA